MRFFNWKTFRNFPSVDFRRLTPATIRNTAKKTSNSLHSNYYLLSISPILTFHREKKIEKHEKLHFDLFFQFSLYEQKFFHIRTLQLFFSLWLCDFYLFSNNFIARWNVMEQKYFPHFFSRLAINSIRLWYRNWYFYYAISFLRLTRYSIKLGNSQKSFLLAKFHQKSHVKII